MPYDNIDSHGIWRNSIDEDIVEVLAEVPSYDDYVSLKKFMVEGINAVNNIRELEAENAKLKKQLTIAVEALKDIYEWADDEFKATDMSKEALEQIKELDK